MQICTSFPREIVVLDQVFIPMSDGCRLAARIWLPRDAERAPVPAIFEYVPYRKDDRMAGFDSSRHPYFAGHGYAAVRVDMRGSGDSDGILEDEYLPQEQEDAVEVIRWLAQQAWCSGAVGMTGISWGGFNSLQVAARRPPELKAIIAACATDDRYADDVHYIGGCVLARDMLPWASSMLMANALPPYPDVVGEEWRERWLERMEMSPPFIKAWLGHQRRDGFWKRGSVCEDYSAIDCAVYMVGGWGDAYTSAIPRLLAAYDGPRKGLIGPWSHEWPDQASPGPAIGFLQECLRWWDYWLKDIETGIMDEPMLRVWMQDAVEPRTSYDERPGRWVAEEDWPSKNVTARRFWLNDRALGDSPKPEQALAITGKQATGLDAGDWIPSGASAEFPPDQRREDAASMSFTSAPLPERIEILGIPEVIVSLAASHPTALLVARLCDVGPTGSSTLISRGLLNLTHRDSHKSPTPLIAGQRYTVRIPLKAVAYALPAGHRLRVALSPTYWPWAWPSPTPVRLTVFSGADSQLELPVRAPRAADAELPPFEPPEQSARTGIETLSRPPRERIVRHDVAADRYELTVAGSTTGVRVRASGAEYQDWFRDTFTIVEGDPLSAVVRCERACDIRNSQCRTRVETESVMSAEVERFLVTNVLEAYEDDTRMFAKTWSTSIPRDLV